MSSNPHRCFESIYTLMKQLWQHKKLDKTGFYQTAFRRALSPTNIYLYALIEFRVGGVCFLVIKNNSLQKGCIGSLLGRVAREAFWLQGVGSVIERMD